MKICAIVLNFRNAQQTASCLSSLNGQGCDQVLVVDNSGNELHAVELEKIMAQLRGGVDYTLHLIKPHQNLGFARGVNLALNDAAARHCDAFLLINNDAVALPGMAERLANALGELNFDVVAPTVIDSAGVVQPMLWYQRFFGLLTERQLPGSFPYLSGCCLLVHREMIQGGKLFDEDFFMYGEDTQLGWHLTRAGKTVGSVKDAVVRHEGGGSSRQCQLFYEYHTARAHVLLALKTHKSALEIPLLLIAKSLGLGLRALLRCSRCGKAAPLLAFVFAWFQMHVRVP